MWEFKFESTGIFIEHIAEVPIRSELAVSRP